MACTARDAPPPLPPAAGRGGLPENPRPKLCAAAAQPEALHRPGQEPPPTAGWSLPALRPSAPLRAARARTRRGSTGSTASAPSPHSQAAHPLRPRPRGAAAAREGAGRAGRGKWGVGEGRRERERGGAAPPPPGRKCALGLCGYPPSVQPRLAEAAARRKCLTEIGGGKEMQSCVDQCLELLQPSCGHEWRCSGYPEDS
ncbi:uncharacterized protein LOC118143812 [Callithrix jacchus]